MDMFDTSFGTFAEDAEGTVTLRYERVFARPRATVWSAITQPERIAEWLGPTELEPRVGGRFAVMVGPRQDIPIKGEVLAWEPPAVLACAWTWPDGVPGVIRYALSAEGPQATRLVFTHSGVRREQMHSVLPGWHLYLERLQQATGGETPERDFSARHADIRASYGRRYGVESTACEH